MALIAVTGPTTTDAFGRGVIFEFLASLEPGSTILSGGAPGVDTVAATAAWLMGHELWLVAPAAPYNEELDHLADRIIRCQRGNPDRSGRTHAASYKLRDQRLVDEADWVHGFPRTAVEERRSGTWMTIRMARRAAKHAGNHPLAAA